MVPTKTAAIRDLLIEVQALKGNRTGRNEIYYFYDGNVVKRSAHNLHGYTQLQLEDMIIIFRRSKYRALDVRNSMESVVQNCTLCKPTGRPKPKTFEKSVFLIDVSRVQQTCPGLFCFRSGANAEDDPPLCRPMNFFLSFNRYFF